MGTSSRSLPVDLAATLHEVRRQSGQVVFLTGAGISAESGIPTFRGEEGYWRVGSRNYRPMELATRAAFSRMPEEVWRWYLYRRSVCAAASPNAGHAALVMAEVGLRDRFSLVTQNVDGMHLRAGNSRARTRQIHGNIDFMRCLVDGLEHVVPIPSALPPHGKDDPFTEVDRQLLSCADGKLARPHVLWFDEYYDERLFCADTAMADAAAADLLVVVGTAGGTNLPRQIAALAHHRGIPIVDINVADNPFARAAQQVQLGWSLVGSASDWLPIVVSTLLEEAVAGKAG